MTITLTRLWQEPSVALNILRHFYIQDVDSLFTNDLLYTLRDHGRIVSYAVIRRRKRYDRLKSVFTFPEHRGKGYAKALLKCVLRDAYQPVILTCRTRLIGLYASVGFQPSQKLSLGVRLRLLLINEFASSLYDIRVHAMTYVPKRSGSDGITANGGRRMLLPPRPSSR